MIYAIGFMIAGAVFLELAIRWNRLPNGDQDEVNGGFYYEKDE